MNGRDRDLDGDERREREGVGCEMFQNLLANRHTENVDHIFCWKLSNFQSCPPKKLFKRIDVQR